MWLLMNDAALSVVQDFDDPDILLVRGRIKGDIESVFPDALVFENSGSDYRFRSFLPKMEVARTIGLRVLEINYPNFKNSIPDPERKYHYSMVWETLLNWQESIYGSRWFQYFSQRYGDENVEYVDENDIFLDRDYAAVHNALVDDEEREYIR